MNEPADPLEEMLRQIRPRSISDTTRRHVAEQVAVTERRRRITKPMIVAALAIAACLLVVFFQNRERSDHQLPVEVTELTPQQDVRVIAENSDQTKPPPSPTVWNYRRAAEGSFEELDRLLVRHAHELLTPNQNSHLSMQHKFP